MRCTGTAGVCFETESAVAVLLASLSLAYTRQGAQDARFRAQSHSIIVGLYRKPCDCPGLYYVWTGVYLCVCLSVH